MENPFFRNYWNSTRPRYSPSSTRGIPVHQQESKPRSQTPKVVSIPVHFVGSKKTTSEAALRIQKVFRGFLVRKNVKKIGSIKTEVEEIERKIERREIVELVRRDAKERLRMNEMLMSLLFRLDSVRGVDSGVREFRKAVIRKAIALQEKLDAIVTEDQPEENVNNDEENNDRDLEKKDQIDPSCNCESGEEISHQTTAITKDPADCSDNSGIADNSVDQNRESQVSVESEQSSGDRERAIEASDQIEAMQVTAESSVEQIAEEPTPTSNSEGNSETKFDEGSSDSAELVLTGETEPSSMEGNNGDTENMEYSSEENSQSSIEKDAEEGNKEKEEEEGKEIEQGKKIEESKTTSMKDDEKSRDCKENTLMMERMLTENARLMALMTHLCERNALQTQMISSLSQRVGNLEKAFVNDKLKRKKKRLENKPDDGKKCGRTL